MTTNIRAADDLPERLSSNYLYHFKKDVEVLKLILRYGFRHSSWLESLPFFNIGQHSFTVCFCDIRFQDSRKHRACYGHNGIALTKDWGIRQNISPVRYIHRTSPGATEDYIKIKTLYRSARELTPNEPERTLSHYLVHCILDDSGELIDGDLKKTAGIAPNILQRAQHAQAWVAGIIQKARQVSAEEDVLRLLNLLMSRIHELHNELEKRDSYMRAYSEDFVCPATGERIQSKVLYDEREWRSIKFLGLSAILEDAELYDTASTQGFLPQKYNLTFNDSDVVAIIAQDEAAKAQLIGEIRTGQMLVSHLMESKVFTVEEFSE